MPLDICTSLPLSSLLLVFFWHQKDCGWLRKYKMGNKLITLVICLCYFVFGVVLAVLALLCYAVHLDEHVANEVLKNNIKFYLKGARVESWNPRLNT